MSAQSARSIMWLTVLLDASVKGLIVLTIAGALSVALRRASAASRHLVWSLALISLIGLPVLSAVLPSWQVPILPRQVPALESQAVQEGRSGILPDTAMGTRRSVAPGRMPGLPVAMGYSDAAPGAMMSETANATVPSAEPVRRSSLRFPLPVWILLAWVFGGVGAIVPLLIGIVAVLGRTRRAAEVTEGTCASLLEELREQLDVRRRVRLLESDDASVPTTWGVLRPVVLVPSEARNWPEERCRMVLVHELAHIRRRDWLTQTLGRVACALHWFNPLVWLAARRLRLESEQACDDTLLRAGYKASGYAHQLLELVRALRPARCAALATVPMARSSRIEERLTAILDATRNRHALTHLSIALALILESCTVMPLAALRPTARNAEAEEPRLSPEPALEKEAGTESKVTLPNGVTVELIGVSYHPSQEQPWWRPDGTLLEEAPYDEVRANVNVGDDQQAREFAVRVGNIPGDERDYLCRVNIIGPSLQVAMSGLYKKGLHVPDLQAMAASLRQHQTTVGVGVGVAAGPWETVASSAGKGVRSADRASGGVVFAEPYEVESQTRITVGDTLADFDCRVIAVDTGGEAHMPSALRGRAGTMRQTTASFHNLALSDIREFRFQARPFSWVEFSDVCLNPGQRSTVKVNVQRPLPVAPYSLRVRQRIEAELHKEIADKLRGVGGEFDALSVVLSDDRRSAQCRIEGLRELKGVDGENVWVPINGELTVGYVGRGIYSVRGSKDLGHVNFNVDTRVEELGEAGWAQPVDYEPALATKAPRERFNYERALNGELARTISGLDYVRSASVRVTIPEKALFKEEQEEPRASVLVELTEAGALSQEQVDAIRHLVAVGVEGLKESNVAVVDTHGNLLAAPGDEPATRTPTTAVRPTSEPEPPPDI